MSRTGSTRRRRGRRPASSKQRTHVEDGVDLADVAEELVAEALALAGAAHQAGDVDELERGRDHLARA